MGLVNEQVGGNLAAMSATHGGIELGAVLEFPFHRLRVVAIEFERDAFFPDAVAQVLVECGFDDFKKPGTHIVTPWGAVQVVATPIVKHTRQIR